MRNASQHITRYTGLLGRFVAIVLFVSSLAACSDEVNPFIGTELPYSVWGTINPQADTQAVRVFLIDDVLQLVSAEPLDADVSILHIDTGDRYAMQDSIIQLRNGDFRHIFWARFNVEYFENYRIEVERSDGQLTRSANIQVPGPIQLNVIPANTNAVSNIIQTVHIEGEPPSLPRIDVHYEAYSVDNQGFRLDENVVTVSYSGTEVTRLDSLFLDIDLRADYRVIRQDFEDKQLDGFICLDDIAIDIHVGNQSWRSPIGVFDENFLVEPGTLSNIENGFGYFGAGFVESVSVLPPNLLLVRAGFFDCVNPNG